MKLSYSFLTVLVCTILFGCSSNPLPDTVDSESYYYQCDDFKIGGDPNAIRRNGNYIFANLDIIPVSDKTINEVIESRMYDGSEQYFSRPDIKEQYHKTMYQIMFDRNQPKYSLKTFVDFNKDNEVVFVYDDPDFGQFMIDIEEGTWEYEAWQALHKKVRVNMGDSIPFMYIDEFMVLQKKHNLTDKNIVSIAQMSY